MKHNVPKKLLDALVVLLLALVLALFASCSLKYTEGVRNVEDSVPEFVFDDATFMRYENNVPTLLVNAKKIEQYKGGNETYATDVQFSLYDDKGELETEGSCELLSSDSREKKYAMYDKIALQYHPQKITIKSNELHWNGSTEQLTTRRSDTITIKKDDMTIIGSGFSASGISSSFAFTGAVSGFIETADDTQSEAEPNGN